MVLKKELNNIIKEEKGTYGIYLVDLKSGKWLGINQKNIFHAASTIKLPLNLYLHRKIARGEITPGKNLTFKEKHFEKSSVIKKEALGTEYSIKKLSKYSIIYSDNIATNMLLHYLGSANLKNFMRALGGTVVSYKENITCPRDMALYMQETRKFTNQYPEQGSKLIGYLSNSIFNNRIPRPLPQDIKIAHKIGNWPPTGTYNDVGYVKHPERPYIISILSKNTSGMQTAFKTIQKISKRVYEYQNSLNKIDISFNGKPLNTDTPPVIKNERVLVPIRFICDVLDAKIHWDEASSKVIITMPTRKIILKIGEKKAVVNKTTLLLDTPPVLYNGRTMVPVRFVSESLNTVVKWNNENKTVKLSTKGDA